jgi:mannosyltransferase OCH1-like enzyme
MLIPKIIHQTWKDERIPSNLKLYVDSWKKYHPQWEYRLWKDNDNRQFIRNEFPWFLRFYDNYSLDIQRVDAVRYFILYEHGGIFLDLDIECFRAIDDFIADKKCIFATEPEKHCRIHGVEQIISNAFMGTVPGHIFFYSIAKELITYTSRTKGRNDFVLDTTGPLMLNRVYGNFPNKTEITLLPPSCFCAFDYQDARRHVKRPVGTGESLTSENAYGVHYFIGSWWERNKSIR